MTFLRTRTFLLALLLLFLVLAKSSAFLSRSCLSTSVTSTTGHPMSNNNQNDATQVWYAGIADAVQNVLTNSPLNEAKKALVKSLAGNYDAAVVRARLDGLISEKPVLMLSFRTCPFCIKAKAILDDKKVQYHVVELDEVKDGKAIRAEMADVLGRTSVPAIWIGGEFIGGCNDGPKGGIVKMNDSGVLDSMLRAAVGAS